MKNKKYKVCRENIYVGEVVKTRCVYHRGIVGVLNTGKGQLDIGSWRSYRSILFTTTEEKLANDLLYNSPNYPILNITDDEICMDFDRSITLVKDAYNLAELLKYFGYNEELTYKDIIKIRKTFFSGKFAYDNCELFGRKEMKPEDWTYYSHGIEITDPKKIKKCIAYERILQLLGHRSFGSTGKNILPREYFDVLNNRRDSTLTECLTYDHEKLDAFAPHKHEEKIKKLSRFKKNTLNKEKI